MGESQEAKPKKKGFALFSKKKKTETPSETEAVQEPEKKKKEKKKKEKKGWFGRKKKAEIAPEAESAAEAGGAEAETAMPMAQEDVEYALILHQYAPTREEDLLRLIQQVGQMTEDKARRLLKVPSLIKRGVSAEEASIAIEKFKQVQAQVKLITMAQLMELQKKQQQSVQPSAPAAPQPSAAPPSVPAAGDDQARYALILRKFDSSQRKAVLELLSSLSGTPVAQLQQSLKTPALVLRDASKDEVTMIAQQFQNIQAEVKMLTMTDLQKLMAKK
jgi:hypothetical protein